MSIEIVQGDIFAISADAMVVPANCQPDMYWGSHIAEQVNKLATDAVKQAREAQGTIALGDSCITKGDGTPFAYLVHSAVLDKYDFNPLFLLRLRQRTSDETLQAAVVSMQREIADYDAIKRVVISAMGAGIGGMNYTKCIEIIASTLKNDGRHYIIAAYKQKHVAIAQNVLVKLGKA